VELALVLEANATNLDKILIITIITTRTIQTIKMEVEPIPMEEEQTTIKMEEGQTTQEAGPRPNKTIEKIAQT
jgi:hypothetical protein